MKNILILTDFSENSWNSIQYALAFLKNGSCNFYLLNANDKHLQEAEELTTNNVGLLKVRDTKIKLKNFINKIKQSTLSQTHSFSSLISDLDIVEATKNIVKNKEIDLIIIGTNGLSSRREMTISSLAEALITKVKCSILIVPKEANFTSLSKVAFPTDYTNYYEAKLLDCLTSSILFSHLKFLYLNKENESLDKEQKWNKNTLKDYFKNLSHSFHSEINENLDVATENFVKKNEIDLIVMGAKNLNLLEQILFRPRIMGVKYYKKTPFLVLHESNHAKSCKKN